MIFQNSVYTKELGIVQNHLMNYFKTIYNTIAFSILLDVASKLLLTWLVVLNKKKQSLHNTIIKY